MGPKQHTAWNEEERSHLVAGDYSRDRHGHTLDVENPAALESQRRPTRFVPPPVPNSEVAVPAATNQDRVWGYVFMAIVAITILSAVVSGNKVFEIVKNHLASWSEDIPGQQQAEAGAEASIDWPRVGFMSVLMLTIGGGLAAGCLHSMIKCQKALLWAASLFIMSFFFVPWVLLASLRGDPWVPAIFALVISVSLISFIPRLFCGTGRLNFAAANLKVAAFAVRSTPGIVRLCLLAVGLQMVWTMTALLATGGTFLALEKVIGPDGDSYPAVDCVFVRPQDYMVNTPVHDHHASGCICGDEKISEDVCDTTHLNWPIYAFGFLAWFWGMWVIDGVLGCTVSGAVASWWFSPDDKARIRGALYRATHSSFGTICKSGVLLTALRLIQMLKIVPGISCILSCCNLAVKYATQYILIFVGIYGLDFSSATRRARELFKGRVRVTVGNDLVTFIRILLLSAASGAALAFVWMIMEIGSFGDLNSTPSLLLKNSSTVIGLLPLGLIAPVLIVSATLTVVAQGFKTVFVCFVQDADALKNMQDPRLHVELTDAWAKLHAAPGQRSAINTSPVVA